MMRISPLKPYFLSIFRRWRRLRAGLEPARDQVCAGGQRRCAPDVSQSGGGRAGGPKEVGPSGEGGMWVNEEAGSRDGR